MNANRNLFLIAAIIGIGIFVLPSTLSMFAGQHSWYDPNNNGIPCAKCHFLEEEELAASGGPHDPDYSGLLNMSANYNGSAGDGNPGGSDFWSGDTVTDRCYGCHQVTGSANSTHALADSWANQNDTVHAAVAVWCIDCHPWVENELTATNAAHKAFYEDLEGGATITGLQNPNQACLGCHTHVGVNLSWTRNEYVSYNVTCDSSGYEVSWNASDDMGTNSSRFQSVAGY
jgi:hypothetical protein